MASVTKVEAGEKITINGKKVPIAPPCDAKENGRWYCVTHGEISANRLQKDCHISDGKSHRMAWLCFEHGPEVP